VDIVYGTAQTNAIAHDEEWFLRRLPTTDNLIDLARIGANWLNVLLIPP
jgi:hypothetical protein